MTRSREKYLFDIIDSCQYLEELTSDADIDRYESNRMFRSAIQRELQIVGEAVMQLNALDPKTAECITEYKRIIGFRHVLVHGYDAIDPEIVWHVVTAKLPNLHAEARTLLEELK